MYNANNVAGNTFYGYKNDNHNVFAEQTDAPEEYYDMLDEIRITRGIVNRLRP